MSVHHFQEAAHFGQQLESCNGRSFTEGLLGPVFCEGVGTIEGRVTTRISSHGSGSRQIQSKITMSFHKFSRKEKLISAIVLA
jgi:hypothetical protein